MPRLSCFSGTVVGASISVAAVLAADEHSAAASTDSAAASEEGLAEAEGSPTGYSADSLSKLVVEQGCILLSLIRFRLLLSEMVAEFSLLEFDY